MGHIDYIERLREGYDLEQRAAAAEGGGGGMINICACALFNVYDLYVFDIWHPAGAGASALAGRSLGGGEGPAAQEPPASSSEGLDWMVTRRIRRRDLLHALLQA